MIDSPQNPLLKSLKRLRQNPGQLRKQGLVWVEGPRWVVLALDRGWVPQHLLLSSELLEGRPEGPALLARLQQERPTEISPKALTRLGETGSSQGVVALFPRPEQPDPPEQGLVLGLFGVQDPGNVGTLVRSAAAFGAEAVALFGPCADPFGIKAVRASAGACFYLPLLQGGEDPVQWCRNGFSLWALDPQGDIPLEPQVHDKTCLLLVGAETGLPSQVLAAAKRRLKIPMDPRSESLNAAMAGTAALALLGAGTKGGGSK